MKKFFLLLALMLALALVLTGCGETVTPEKVDPGEGGGGDAAEKYAVGDTVKMGDLRFTLKGVRYDTGSEYWKPDAGTRWIVFDCVVENTGSESETVSSLLMFKLYDADGYTKDVAIPEDLKGSLDGELGAGRKMAGEIAFTVDEDETAWELIFEPQVFGFGQAIFDVTASDIK